ncbi:hypothetical protein GCM10010168_48860 [Actinoplanes ianthinogenes]|uniref:Uncharacterized protein n=1 Tax=Actinoplanes ianthinogenes TaxID=122358 RepID=A0ABM7LNJ2_9ACTN|nr:hypothetical protein [Actinoplanes ianthinogenes]BCJ40815.1 hypothetical protein Aiant_14720 [Actinoplanes ianthinogenes]GGR25020.1 hypothetical protein GCM10010168_48860 [Actinoplanes ianthinogenes]
MLVLFLLILVLAAACVLAVRGVRAEARAAAEPLLVPESFFAPQSLEGVLCGQLLDGDITRRQYLRSMEGLAARDEERHPLVVPWHLGAGEE